MKFIVAIFVVKSRLSHSISITAYSCVDYEAGCLDLEHFTWILGCMLDVYLSFRKPIQS